jgi:hypothetical protein
MSQRNAPAARFDFVELDASLLRNAAVLAEIVAQRQAPVDYLVLTAGIATTQGFTPTDEGLDQKLAIHYFGRMKIVEKLLPLMRGSTDARVLTVLSGGVHSPYADWATSFDLKDKCVHIGRVHAHILVLNECFCFLSSSSSSFFCVLAAAIHSREPPTPQVFTMIARSIHFRKQIRT